MRRVPDPLELAPAEIRGTSGAGYRMWSSRRRNRFVQALARVKQWAREGNLPELLLEFAVITEFIAPSIPAGTMALPRGYGWRQNGIGEPSVAWGLALFNPSCCDPMPPRVLALQFAADLSSGWLVELARALGLDGVPALMEAW